LGNAQSYVVGVYQTAEADYIAAVNQILNAEAAFDAAIAANADTTAAGTQMATAQVAYVTAVSRLTSGIDAPNGPVGSALSTATDAVSGSYVTAIANVTSAQIRAAQSLQSAQTSVNNQPANVQSAQNAVNNAQTALATAQANLDNAVIKATVAGIVTTVSAQV